MQAQQVQLLQPPSIEALLHLRETKSALVWVDTRPCRTPVVLQAGCRCAACAGAM